MDDRTFVYYRGRALSVAVFLRHVSLARAMMPVASNRPARLMNLCADRYHFLVLFAAAMLEGVITVMPANQSSGELERLNSMHAGMQTVDDDTVADLCQLDHDYRDDLASMAVFMQVPEDRVVAELYTSGSTGMPSANCKCWAELVHGAQRVANRFDLSREQQHVVVATVPPQHMFGFELSVVLPLVVGVSVYHAKPFYPEDLAQALRAVPAPRMLVTTPIHLKACCGSACDWPAIDSIVSSTASLPQDLALLASQRLQAPVREIYGCSEIGAVATRNTTETDSWQLLGDFRLNLEGPRAYLESSILLQPLLLADQLSLQDDGRFCLVGRTSDLVKIGGKRGSLAEIGLRIRSIEGVDDAAVFLATKQGERERLAALVVAPGLGAGEIRRRLSQDIDAVFVPRQIYLVQSLPYSAGGKLPRADLLAMLASNQGSEAAC